MLHMRKGQLTVLFFAAVFLKVYIVHIMQQVIIGFDTTEIMKEIELSGPSEVDFGIEEIEDEDSYV